MLKILLNKRSFHSSIFFLWKYFFKMKERGDKKYLLLKDPTDVTVQAFILLSVK